MSIAADLQMPSPGDLVELIIVDLSAIGGETFYWVPSLNTLKQTIIFDGTVYVPYPVEITGYERSGQGSLARPKASVANVTGEVSALCREFEDLIGAKVTRRRTFGKYLDAVNFPGGVNPDADPSERFPDDVYFVSRKSMDKPPLVEFELAAPPDLEGVTLPGRSAIANVCGWIAIGGYRGPYCGYAGPPVADKKGNPTDDFSVDNCGGLLSDCRLRFPEELPFGGFPALGLYR